MDSNEKRLKQLGEIAKELGEDLKQRLALIDKMIRDCALGVEHMESVQELQLRLDRVMLRDKGREMGERLLTALGAASPDQGTVLELRLLQTLLLNDIDLSKDSRLLDSLVKAVEKLGGETPAEESIEGKQF